MATVDLARRIGEQDLVAIKTVRPDELDDESAATTLRDEARVLAHIRHPNVVPLLDVFSDGGKLHLVMPFVRGSSLSELMIAISKADGVTPASVVSAIGQDMLAGLGAAHRARGTDGVPLHIVHRDVSPQNVMVSADGHALVLDFGIAKAQGRSAKTTRDGALKGKIAYMAPEQVHGLEIDARGDLYAVGVILWEMLALDRLFAGANDADTLRRVLLAKVPSLATYRNDLPPDIDTFFARALAGSPNARFASAEEMSGALQLLLPRASPSDVAAFTSSFARPAPVSVSVPTPVESHRSIDPLTLASNEAPAPKKATRRGFVMAASVGLVVFVTLAGFAARRTHAEGAPPSPEPQGTQEAPTASAISVVPPPPPPTAPLSTPDPVTAPSAPGTHKAGPKKAPASVDTPTSKACHVPYTIDEHGRKKFRPECLP
ncbi:MAG: serine/threonine protein kinase [Myxococcales bacterium]|nr:serine/threonine protein kinase [Myxococcales bacterium]